MKLPTLLLTLLSTAAIAQPIDNVIIQPACYVNNEPQYLIDKCPQPSYAPAYYRPSYGAMLARPAPTLDTRPLTQPAPTINYETSSRPRAGVYFIDQTSRDSVNFIAPDGGVTFCSSTACITP